uniref:Uncharacterized protein n=1 Tax=Arundo donax TaxID=35708 RepID=A0A0A8Z440_ARUDO
MYPCGNHAFHVQANTRTWESFIPCAGKHPCSSPPDPVQLHGSVQIPCRSSTAA